MLLNGARGAWRLVVVLGFVLACLIQVDAQAAQQDNLDLAVSRVWVGGDCRVKVQMLRSGGGRLPSRLGGLTVLRITINGSVHDYSFKQVDPSGSLLQGPAKITFHSPLKVQGQAVITALVDPLNRIPERQERANNRTTVKVAATKACSATLSAREALDGLKIVQAYLGKGGLHLIIQQKPRLSIPPKMLKRIIVRARVAASGERRAWPLSQVYAVAKRDSQNRRHFNTRLTASPGSRVIATLVLGKYSKSHAYTLPGKPPARAKGPGDTSGAGAAKGPSHGIMIFKPTSRKVAHRGGTVSVVYGVSRDVSAGVIEFALYRGPQKFNSITVSYQQPTGSAPAEQSLDFPIPGNVAYGQGYYIKATLGGRWGESDQFSIQPLGDSSTARSGEGVRIQVLAPNGPAEMVHHSMQTISWRVTGPYHGTPAFNVSLVQGGTTIARINSSHMVFNQASGTYTLAWTVPSHRHGGSGSSLLSGQGFRIKVADRNSSAEDTNDRAFPIVTINPERPLAGGITISRPRLGARYAAGDTLIVEWAFNPQVAAELGYLPDTAYVALIKLNRATGMEQEVWGGNYSPNRPVSWNIPANQDPGDYYVVVRNHPPNTPVAYSIKGVTGSFRIVPRDHLELIWPPRSSATPQTIDVFRSYLIRWDALGAARNATLDIILSTRQAGIPSIHLIRNIPARDGQWRWTLCPMSNWIHYGTHFQIILRTNGMGDNNLRSASDFFNIPRPELVIRRPAASQSWPLGQNRAIHWRRGNIPTSQRLRIVLMKGNESYQDIAANVPVSDERFVWQVGSALSRDYWLRGSNSRDSSPRRGMGGAPPPPPGCDYRIRLSIEGCFALQWYSPTFCLR